MIKRFIKIILCISICFIQISTYAGNVSVSDGSAFVTKSEMSYQLNNLSNRMTQLENSLDSKIDTLVSSYLTRNGVWNGVKQTLSKNTIIDYWNTNTYPLSYDFRSQISTGTLTQGVEYKLRSGSWTLINSCNKSGMLVGKWDVIDGWTYARSKSSSVGTDGRNFVYSQAGVTDNPISSNTSECSLWISGVCLFSSCPIQLGVYKAADVTTNSTYFMPQAGIETPMIFVNKNDKVIVDYDVAITPQTNDAKVTWENRNFVPCGSAPGVAIVFGDFYIY